MGNEELALRTWVESNLEVTTATLSLEMARRWQKLLMRDAAMFFTLAVYGFVVLRRRQAKEDACYPQQEFADFCAEFVHKIGIVVRGRGYLHSVPMFQHVGVMTMHCLFGATLRRNQ